MRIKICLFSLFALLFFTACEKIQKAADVVIQTTAREAYARGFDKNNEAFQSWKQAFENAKNDSLQILLPYSESGIFSENGFNAYSYNMQLIEGEKLVVEIETQVDSASVFIDLFKFGKDPSASKQLLKSSEINETSLSLEIREYGFYKIVVQPEMNLQFPFILKIYTEPIYTFPVSGGKNEDVKSFWAATRDGGNRSHEGIDIFAKRGTPVVAITEGRVSSTGERGIGGKQVWMRDGIFGKTMYYAHLDSIAVTSGKRVKTGDTLGFVGNTGNAITTEPHLHFGIYKARKGAVDPYPYIKKTEIQEVQYINEVTLATVNKNKAELRKGPIPGFEQFASLSKNDTVMVLGKNEEWFHIVTRDSVKGFMHQSLLEELPSN